MKEGFWKRLLVFFGAALLVVYVGFQIYKSTYSGVKTETVVSYTMSDDLETMGLAVRDEMVVQKSGGWVAVKYPYQNGTKVKKNAVIAQFYAKEADVSVQEQIDVIDQEIALLEQLNALKESNHLQPEDVDQSLTAQLVELMQKNLDNDLLSVKALREAYLYLVSERQMIVGSIENFDDRIAQLRSERTALQNSYQKATSSIYASASGYFLSSTDGMEDVVDYDAVDDLTLDRFELLLEQNPQGAENDVGRIVLSHEWYLMCHISADDAMRLKESEQVSIRIPLVSTKKMTARVKAINQPDKLSDALLILACDQVDDAIFSFRKTPVRISFEEYTGLRVHKSAIHFKECTVTKKDEEGDAYETTENVEGVYILYGNRLYFREIVPLFTSGDYVICKEEPANSLTGNVLKLYDEIVVSGRNLEDGKRVN